MDDVKLRRAYRGLESGIEQREALGISVALAHDGLAAHDLVGETPVVFRTGVPDGRSEDRHVAFVGKPRGVCIRNGDDAVDDRKVTVYEKTYVHALTPGYSC